MAKNAWSSRKSVSVFSRNTLWVVFKIHSENIQYCRLYKEITHSQLWPFRISRNRPSRSLNRRTIRTRTQISNKERIVCLLVMQNPRRETSEANSGLMRALKAARGSLRSTLGREGLPPFLSFALSSTWCSCLRAPFHLLHQLYMALLSQ